MPAMIHGFIWSSALALKKKGLRLAVAARVQIAGACSALALKKKGLRPLPDDPTNSQKSVQHWP